MRQNHVPLRTCVACRTKGQQLNLVRVTRLQNSKLVAGTSREVGGRGAYLCRNIECFEIGLTRGSLERSLKGHVTQESRDNLMDWARSELASEPVS